MPVFRLVIKNDQFEIWRSAELFQNTYLVIYPGKIFVVDPGLPTATYHIKSFLKNKKLPFSSIKTVFITHFHMDHMGGVRDLLKIADPVVCIHRKVREYISGREEIKFPRAFDLLKLWRLGLELRWRTLNLQDARILVMPGSPWLPVRKNLNLPFPVDAFLHGGEKLPNFPDWTAIYTPGHTLDSMCLINTKAGIIFTGDTILSINGKACPNPFHVSKGLLRKSVGHIKKLKPRMILPGHSSPAPWREFSNRCG